MPLKPHIVITKSRSGHYTATAILGSFKRSERKLDNLQSARSAAEDLARQVEVEVDGRRAARAVTI